MPRIITIPNDDNPAMNAERQRIAPWAPRHGWIYTGYNDESDHIAQIRQAAGGAPIDVLDFDCEGSPSTFNHTSSGTALQFGRNLALIPGFSGAISIFLDACNTGLTSDLAPVAIAQTLADGAGCTVYGTKGYMTGTYAEGNEQCYAGPDLHPPFGAYPGAETASGRNVWKAFRPRGFRERDFGEMRGVTVGVDRLGRVWATFDPSAFREVPMTRANSITIYAPTCAPRDLENLLEEIMRSEPVKFPALRMASDITINYVRDEQVKILDVYANGGLLKDRISGQTWSVSRPEDLLTLIRQELAKYTDRIH